jgi:hypothetical protein
MTSSAKTLRAQRAWNKAHPFTVKVTRYKIVTPTLAALERAAMRWWRGNLKLYGKYPLDGSPRNCIVLATACAAHAAALKRKRTGRR